MPKKKHLPTQRDPMGQGSFGGVSVAALWSFGVSTDLETEVCGVDFRLSRLGSGGRHWNSKSGSRSRSKLDSGSERRLELDPFM